MSSKIKLPPTAAGFKRNLFIMGGIFVAGILLIVGFAMMSSRKQASVRSTELGQVQPRGQAGDVTLTPATKASLAHVQTNEANAAREQGKSYMPDPLMGHPEKVDVPRDPPKPERPSMQGALVPPALQQSAGQRAQPTALSPDEQKRRELIMQGLLAQMQAAMVAAGPARVQTVAIADLQDKNKQAATTPAAAKDVKSSAAHVKGTLLVAGNDIVPAELLTPIDTDRTTFALVRITGGKLKGAMLRGQIKPMNQSGDVEDVGVVFKSMTLNDETYKIDAMALNEQDATDAMNGKVDRRIFSRYVMPIIMAGLSGASTYFTAKGTPSSSLLQGTTGNSAVVVSQQSADQQQAKDQGIGKAVDKAVSVGERQVDKASSRPNQVTLAAHTTIGVIFNNPVYSTDQL